jgi:hypothetical protein|tara:strand:+ start:1329 stop:1595 length:267 start_codon:yes stop_codon:yes gene_type:complete
MMVLPAAVLVFSALILGIQASMVHYRLQQEAHANARVASLEGEVAAREEGEWLCVTETRTLEEGLWKLRPLTLSAEACALNPSVGREF